MSESNGQKRNALGFEKFHALTEAIRKNRRDFAAADLPKEEVLKKLSEAAGFPVTPANLASAVEVMKVPPFWKRKTTHSKSQPSDRTRRLGRIILTVVDEMHAFAARCGEQFDPEKKIDVAELRSLIRGHIAEPAVDAVDSEQ